MRQRMGWPGIALHSFMLVSSVFVLMNLERTYRDRADQHEAVQRDAGPSHAQEPLAVHGDLMQEILAEQQDEA